MCFKKNKRGKVLVLIDWENLSKSVITTFRITERYSELQELNKVIEKIADEVGDIYKVKVFCPLHQASLWGKDFYKIGFVLLSRYKKLVAVFFSCFNYKIEVNQLVHN